MKHKFKKKKHNNHPFQVKRINPQDLIGKKIEWFGKAGEIRYFDNHFYTVRKESGKVIFLSEEQILRSLTDKIVRSEPKVTKQPKEVIVCKFEA
jgi:hypothetical protein